MSKSFKALGLAFEEHDADAGLPLDDHPRVAQGLADHGLGVGGSEGLDLRRDVHRAELGTAHGAEVRVLEAGVGQRLIVHGARGLGSERELELAVPVEAVAGAG